MENIHTDVRVLRCVHSYLISNSHRYLPFNSDDGISVNLISDQLINS